MLVAFTSDVALNGGEPVRESKCNGFSESQTAELFDTDDHQLMVVAEKFQAAFEPYYRETVAPPSDPNLLYDTRHALDEFGVLNAGRPPPLPASCW